MTLSKTRIYLIFSSLLLIVLVLGFTGGLNISAFKKKYTDSLIASYAVGARNVVRKIEYAVKYGKPIKQFFDIHRLLAEVKTTYPEIEDVSVIQPDGHILYSLYDKRKTTVLDTALLTGLNASIQANKATGFVHRYHQNKLHLFIPISNRDNPQLATLDLVFDDAIVTQRTDKYLHKLLISLAIMAIAVAAFLTVTLMTLRLKNSDAGHTTKRLLALVMITLGMTQIAYGVINYRLFKQGYIEIAQENASVIVSILAKDIESVVAKGIPYTELSGIETWLGKVVRSVPEIEDIRLRDQSGRPLYAAHDQTAPSERTIKPSLLYEQRLPGDSQKQQPQLQVILSASFLASKLHTIILDTATVAVTSLIFMVELGIFLMLLLRKRATRQDAAGQAHAAAMTSNQLIRPLTFTYSFAFNMSLSFIPIIMEQLYEPLWGLSPNVVIGLPTSAEILGTILTALLTGWIMERRGWRPPFLCGIGILMAGTVCSGLADTAVSFIIARGITGVGYGFTWMAARGFTVLSPAEADQRERFNAHISGVFSGLICGSVIGAILSDRLGFSAVFFIGAALMSLTILFALCFASNIKLVKTEPQAELTEHPHKWRTFLSDPYVPAFFMLMTLPFAACTMFINYFFPVYSKGLGVSQSNVGRMFLVYGACIIYLGPVLERGLSKYLSRRQTALLASGLSAAALLLFLVHSSFWMASVTLVVLAIASSFGLTAQNAYFFSLPSTRALGKGTALSIKSTIDKIGQMIGPNVFALALVAGVGLGIGMVGIVTLGTLLIFAWITRQPKSNLMPNRRADTDRCHKRVTELRRLDLSYLDRVANLQTEVWLTLKDHTLFNHITREALTTLLSQRGLAVGVFYRAKLIGFAAALYPGDAPDNLGRDGALPVAEQHQVVHLEIVFVHPDFRGMSLQKTMYAELLSQLNDRHDWRYLYSTVAPGNLASINSTFSFGLHIIKLKKKYQNHWRYIFFKDRMAAPIDAEAVISMPSVYLEDQLTLFNAGFVGVAQRIDNDIPKLLFTQPTAQPLRLIHDTPTPYLKTETAETV